MQSSYHNPRPDGDGVSSMDVNDDIWMRTTDRGGMADVLGQAMYGQDGWAERVRRQESTRKRKSILGWFFATGCLVISALITVASVLALVLLVKWLVSLL